METSRKFSALSEEFIEVSARHDPVAASILGIHDYEHHLPDDSPDGIRERLDWLGDFDRRLSLSVASESLELPQRIELRFLRSRVEALRWEHEHYRAFAVNPVRYPENAVTSMLILLSRAFAPLEERKEAVVSRLMAVPEYLQTARRSLEHVPERMVGMASEASITGASFVDRVVRTLARHFPGESERIEHAGTRARLAFIHYQEFLERDLAPRATKEVGVGEALLAMRLEHEHLLSPDVKEWERIARSEIARLRGALEDEARRIDPSKPWPEQIRAARENHPVAQRLRETYQGEIDRARALVEERRIVPIPEGKLEVVEAPSFIRSVIPSPGYLPPAAFDFERTGYFSVTAVDQSRPREEQDEKLAAHPFAAIPLATARIAYPGRHVLHLHGIHAGSRLRRLASSEPFEEGWALYSADRAREEGFFQNPLTRLFQLRALLFAACRAVLDVGLHGRTLGYEEAMVFLHREVALERPQAEIAVRRCLLHPTHAMSGLVGLTLINEMRDEAMARMGLRFSPYEFHTALLAGGALPPVLVKEEVRERIGVA